ncbi:hypothetical protein F5B22DRAFT_445316 [Xylaria bambusicola]|uniref:uncharacterized protein n=1 Tax=Xylaria bambusicola TaxID=326684 RepID=UPI00200776CC|nr:uncharacterized protein F5B22DRAFT_445316 [Xylaria bambusicola]KAI0506509.1 hypothetical protein F5B22DRAFT_445316 [Xylaria bambusicola]
MLVKEATRVLSSRADLVAHGASLPITCTTPLSSSTSPSSPLSTKNQQPRAHRGQHMGFPARDVKLAPLLECNRPFTRCYASASQPSHSRPSSAPPDYTWPTSVHPTPYEILAQPKDARYDKALFYQLVKIYHPDRNYAAADSPIPLAVRLERYRLVVAANEILSDDAKRRAYDLYGAGWRGNRTLESLYREADRSWRNEPGNASRNATWEDWERWRCERNGEKPPQTPVYMSNELFVIVLCAFVILGSYAQAQRVTNHTVNIVELRDQKHAAISDDLRRRQDQQSPLNRHERVENFLRQRNLDIPTTANCPVSDPC